MSIFNENLRYFCKRERLSQQRLADLMEIKRGKVAGYFYDTQPKPEFYDQFGEQFGLNMGKFLTIAMNADNYASFFDMKNEVSGKSTDEGSTSSNLLEVLIAIKQTDPTTRDGLIDQAILLYGKMQDENSKLKDANMELKSQLLELLRTSKH